MSMNGVPKTDLELTTTELDVDGLNVAVVGGTGGLGRSYTGLDYHRQGEGSRS